MATIGFIGLGVMGHAMARNLLRAGHTLQVYDLNAQAVTSLVKDGAADAGSCQAASAGAEFVITMLPDGPDVEQAVFGAAGVLEGLGKDALFINMSTILPDTTIAIGEKLKAAGHPMVDAPVGLSSQHAIEGTLLILAGGEAADVERARPLLAKMGRTIIHTGAVGTGSAIKVINNQMASSIAAATAEALNLAQACGLELDLAVEVLQQTAAGKGMLGAWPNKVLKGDVTPGFMLDLSFKDQGLGLELGARRNVPLLVAAAARQYSAIGRAQGHGRDDASVVYEAVKALREGK